MNWWYMAQTSLPDSREVAILCRVLGVSENEALGILHRWLAYINTQTEDGSTGLLPCELDRVMHFRGCSAGALQPCSADALHGSNAGVYAALEKCGWATLDDAGEVVAVDFDRHNSQSARKRVLCAARVAKSREKKRAEGCSAGALQPCSADALPDKRRIYNKENGSTDVEPKERRGARPSGAAEVDAYLSTLPVLKLTPDQRQRAAAAYFDEMESVGWVDKQGRNVWDWRAAARRWAASWANNEHTPFRGGQRQQGLSRNNMTSNGNGVNNYDIR